MDSPFRAVLDSIDAGEELEGLSGLLHRFNEQLADSAALTQLRT